MCGGAGPCGGEDSGAKDVAGNTQFRVECFPKTFRVALDPITMPDYGFVLFVSAFPVVVACMFESRNSLLCMILTRGMVPPGAAVSTNALCTTVRTLVTLTAVDKLTMRSDSPSLSFPFLPFPRTPVWHSNVVYWDTRYSAETESVEWLLDYRDLKPVLLPLLTPAAEVFLPGCGTSGLGAALSRDGFRNVSQADFSSVAIRLMRSRHSGADFSDMDFNVLDATELPDNILPASFDVIVDKALSDAVLCGAKGASKVTAMYDRFARVLKRTGTLVVVSHADPAARLPLLAPWKVTHREVPCRGAAGVAHVYLCQPLAGSAPHGGGVPGEGAGAGSGGGGSGGVGVGTAAKS